MRSASSLSSEALRRAVIVAVPGQGDAPWPSPVIHKATQKLLALGRCWLNVESPPVRLIEESLEVQSVAEAHVGTKGAKPALSELTQPIVDACTQLADQTYLEELGRGGYTVDPPDEIDLWLLLDLSSPAPVELQAGKNDTRGAELASISKQSQLLPVWLDHWISQVFRRLNIRLRPKLLILSHPSRQPAANLWVERVFPLCTPFIFLAGPINHGYVQSRAWWKQAMLAWSIRLWGAVSEPVHWPRPDRPGQWVEAIGAAAWLSPAQKLAEAAGEQWLLAQLTGLESLKELPAGIEHLKVDWHALQSDLTATTPVALHDNIVHLPMPSWSALSGLASALPKQLDQAVQRRVPRQTSTRTEWQSAQIARWTAALAQHVSDRIGQPGITPRFATLRRELALVAQNLDQAQQALGAELAACQERIARLATAVVDARTQLQKICSQFPRAMPGRLLLLALQPWSWPGLATGYFIVLPQRMRALGEVCLRQAQARWRFENLLCVQHVLEAMSTSLKTSEATVERAQANVSALRLRLENRSAERTWQELAPWNQAQVAGLVSYLKPEPLFHPSSPFSGSAVSWGSLEADELWAALCNHARLQFAEVASWSPWETLSNALPAPTALQEWIEGFAESALPLWPHQQIADDIRINIQWLTESPFIDATMTLSPIKEQSIGAWSLDGLPEQVIETAGISVHYGGAAAKMQTQARIHAALEAVADTEWGEIAVPGLFCMQSIAVNLGTPV